MEQSPGYHRVQLPAGRPYRARGVGLRTLPVRFDEPGGEYVAKDYFVWNSDPELGGDGDLYQEFVPTEPVEYRYYGLHDVSRVQTAWRRVPSKLSGPKRFLGNARARPRLTPRLRHLVERADLRGVGGDFVKDDQDRFWAVDGNLAAGYRNTGLESALYESISASLRDH